MKNISADDFNLLRKWIGLAMAYLLAVSGIATAASLWVTGAIGISANLAAYDGAVMLTIIRIVVVFPAPFGPSNPNTRPARTARLSSRTAVNSPKLLLTPSSLTVISLAAI